MKAQKKKKYTVFVSIEVSAENIIEAMVIVGEAIEIHPKYKLTISSNKVFESKKLKTLVVWHEGGLK